MDREILVLKAYFKKNPSVLLAFLFGSQAKRLKTQESDLDLAVYLKEKDKADEIWFALVNIIKKEIDLVCLNDAPATLISNVLKTGIPLIIKDRKLYEELYLKTSSEAEDFLKFAEDFWAIYQRSKSLISEDRVRLLTRFQFLDSELKDIEEFKQITFKEYQENKTKRRNIERWTENIINATIDIAKIVLASEKKRMPKTYQDALGYFGSLVGLTEKESKSFSKFANLRNILAHEYLDILYGKIQDFLKEYPKFYKKIFNFLEKRK